MTRQITGRRPVVTYEARPDLMFLVFVQGPVALPLACLKPFIGWGALCLAAIVCFTCTAIAAWSQGGPRNER